MGEEECRICGDMWKPHGDGRGHRCDPDRVDLLGRVGELFDRVRALEAERDELKARCERAEGERDMASGACKTWEEQYRLAKVRAGEVEADTVAKVVAWLRDTPSCLRNGGDVYGPYQDAAEILANAIEHGMWKGGAR